MSDAIATCCNRSKYGGCEHTESTPVSYEEYSRKKTPKSMVRPSPVYSFSPHFFYMVILWPLLLLNVFCRIYSPTVVSSATFHQVVLILNWIGSTSLRVLFSTHSCDDRMHCPACVLLYWWPKRKCDRIYERRLLLLSTVSIEMCIALVLSLNSPWSNKKSLSHCTQGTFLNSRSIILKNWNTNFQCIILLSRITLTLSCSMLLTHFPMDYQECFVKIESCKYYYV